jgi:hypothetical protein
MLIYTQNGVQKAQHVDYGCNYRNKYKECRTYYGHDFYQTKGNIVYENDALKHKILVTSSQTAFEIEYLIEIAG